MKCLPVIFVAILLAGAALGSVGSPVEAADRGYAHKCGGGKIFLHAKEKRLLTRHNNARRNHGLRPFCVSSALQKAARAHSKDMIQRDYFSHDTKGKNEDACTRIRRFGYRWSSCGENIGYNTTPDRMFHSWMHSSGHRRNILDGKFHNIGIGIYNGYYFRTRTTMYTVDFGARR